MLRETGLKFYIVIEPQDYEAYLENFNKDNLLDNYGYDPLNF